MKGPTKSKGGHGCRLVLEALEHPNVLKLLDFFEDERFYYLAAWPLGFEVAGFSGMFFYVMS